MEEQIRQIETFFAANPGFSRYLRYNPTVEGRFEILEGVFLSVLAPLGITERRRVFSFVSIQYGIDLGLCPHCMVYGTVPYCEAGGISTPCDCPVPAPPARDCFFRRVEYGYGRRRI